MRINRGITFGSFPVSHRGTRTVNGGNAVPRWLGRAGPGYARMATCLRVLGDERSDDLSTGVLIVIILIDLGLLTFGVRGRVY